MKKLILILFLIPLIGYGQGKFTQPVKFLKYVQFYDTVGLFNSIRAPLFLKQTDTLVSKLDTANLFRHGSLSKWCYNKIINGSQWVTSGSNIYYSLGNVGIGSSSSLTNLEVYGTDNGANSLGIAFLRSSNGYGQDVGSQIMFGGNAGSSYITAFGGVRGAKMNATENNTRGYISILTTNADESITEATRIDADKNLTQVGKVEGSNIETNTTSQSVRLGIQSGYVEDESSPEGNVYIGYRSGYSNITGSSNSFLGYGSGYNSTSAYSTMIGASSGYNTKSGLGNVFIGYGSGYNNKYGSNNIYIGKSSGYYGVNYSNKLIIDNQSRTDSATQLISALIVGEFNATVANQKVSINSGDTRVGATSTNYTQFESDGTMKMVGNATVFDDLMFPFETGTNAGNPYPTFDSDSMYYNFVIDTTGVTKCIMYFTIQLPHSYKEGSTIYPHIHYKYESGVGTPTFMMKYKWTNIGANTTTPTWKWYTMGTTTATTDKTHQMVHGAGLSGSGKTISSIIRCAVYVKSQTGTGTIHAYQFDIHIEKDTGGSRTETTK